MKLKTRLLSACVFALFASQVAAETKITFRYNDGDVAVIEAAVSEFEAANPEIDVVVERIAWSDARAQFLREAAVGAGPDVVHLAFVWPLEMGQAGALLPLNDLIKRKGLQSGFGDFIAQDLARAANGDIFAVPWTTDTFTLVYNKDLLAQAGFSKFPADWPGLLNASRTIFAKTGKTGFGFGAGSASSNMIWFMLNYYWWSNGKALVIEDGNGGYKMGITAEEIAASFDYFGSFMSEGGNPKANVAVSTWSDPSIIGALLSGEQAIAFMPPATFRELIAAYQEQAGTKATPFASATIPKGSAGGISHLGGRSLGINANSDNPEEAYKLIQFLTGRNFFEKFLKTQMPAQNALLAKVDFGEEFSGFAAQLANGRSWGAYANPKTPIGAMWNEVGREFGSYIIAEKSSLEAGKAVVAFVEDLLD